MFLNLVDTLTTWHLRVLKLFDDPIGWAEENQHPFPKGWHTGGTKQIVEHAYPELTRNSELYNQIVRDLETYGLAHIPSAMMSLSGMLASRSSGLGRQFLEYVSTPRPLKS
jgi:hypothetical protein